MIDVIVAGHICLDIIPQFRADAGSDLSAYLSPGRLSEIGDATLSTGGAVSNTGLNLKRMGIETRLMGKTGDDLFGHAIVDIVSRYGQELAEGMLVVPGETSSYTVVINPPHIDRMFLHCPGANHSFSADDVQYEDFAAEAPTPSEPDPPPLTTAEPTPEAAPADMPEQPAAEPVAPGEEPGIEETTADQQGAWSHGLGQPCTAWGCDEWIS